MKWNKERKRKTDTGREVWKDTGRNNLDSWIDQR